MSNSTPVHSATQHNPGAGKIRAHSVPVRGALAPYVNALMAFEMAATGPMPLAIVPHESLVLSVQLGRGRDGIEGKGMQGELTRLTGIRRWTGRFTGAGDCITLLALLTPLGAVQLLESRPLDAQPRIRARVDGLLDRRLTCQIESTIALAATLDDKLSCFAAWLEARSVARRRLAPAALRAGRAAMRLCAEPLLPMEALAGEQHVSRRQLERDFGCYIGVSPRQLARVVRVQAVSRCAQAGAHLAAIAADTGFADQAHMSRTVQQLTGLSPLRLARAGLTPMGHAFRRATAGGTVYL
jgi:AraC-like DNA-binding protein